MFKATEEQIAKLDFDEFKQRMTALRDEQVERLNKEFPDRPWWADYVFFMRDIKSFCDLLNATGNEEFAEFLSGIVASTEQKFEKHVGVNIPVADLAKELEILDTVAQQELSKQVGDEPTIQ